MLKQSKIAQKLILGFCSLISILLLFGVYALYDLHKVSELSRTIYNHPLVVSNAALQANVSIAKMHRSMKDVVLFHSSSRIQQSIESVNEEEEQVYRQLNIVKLNILGEEGKTLENNARKSFNGWYPIRNEVIRLVQNDQRENAADITIGKGANYVTLLETNMLGLTNYARDKASEFFRETEKVYLRLNIVLTLFLVLSLLTSFLVTFFTLKVTLLTEKNFKESEDRYRSLIEDQIDLVCRITPDGKFVFVNDMYCQFFNKSKKELIGSKWQPLPVDDDIEIIKEKLSELSFSNPTVIIENRVISGKGSIHWMQFINHGFFDARENLLEIQSVGRDITERKLAEKELSASEFRLSNHLQNTPVGALSWDLDFKATEWNPAAEAMFGYSKAEAVGKHVTELILPKDLKEMVDSVFRDLLSGKGGTHSTNDNITKDGRRIICDWYNTILKDFDGKVIGAASLVQNITERKQAEETLKKTQRLLTETEKIGKVGGWEFNVETEKMVWTEEIYNIHEITPTDDLTVTKGINYYTPASKPIIEQALQRAINHGEPFDLELEIITDKGNLRTVHAVGKADLKHNRVHGFFQDITIRKMLQEESEINKTILLEAEKLAGFGGWQWDIENDSWTLSQNWLKIHGCSNKYLTTEELIKIAHPDDIPKIQKAFDRVVKEGGTYHIEHRIIDQTTGEIKYIHAYGEARLNDSGKAVQIFGAAQDITDKKKIEAQLHQAQKMESVGQLAGGVAHEINNPINGIMNYAQLIQDKIGDENPLSEYTLEIIHETERVSKIVKNLLVFARQENETHSPARMKDIVDDTMTLIQTVLKRDQVTLLVDISEDLPKIKCRSQQIQQVVMNLITNARDSLNGKYPEFDDNKKIEISSVFFEKDDKGWIRTTVEDRGLGLAADTMERMFDPFYTTKDRSIGTGLGLSISYGIVTDHHGELSVESESGMYTRFHMDLPVDNDRDLPSAL